MYYRDKMENIDRNFRRLQEDDYSIEKLFRPQEYDWPGDWEGRALLAFTCHYAMGKENPCMHQMVKVLPKYTNEFLYFGALFDGTIADEQQLSGHSWYLCGLIEYYKLFHSEAVLQIAKSVVEHLYLPALQHYDKYPLDGRNNGGVSGNITGIVNDWKLSSDIGCAFMCVDGLSRYYAETKDCRVKEFLDKLISVFTKIDVVKYGFQTHTTLSCARGILTLYKTTNEQVYLDIAKSVFDTYIQHGITLTYENFNWFGRENSWTEPCAVVDSLILATELYKITKQPSYVKTARRIWWNGLQFCLREHGGAGPNTCVTAQQPILQISMYEAPFCCTMRYAEGLKCAFENSFITDETEENIEKDAFGRYFLGDKLLVEDVDVQYPDATVYTVDGLRLIRIPTGISNTKARLRIIF